jgi:hypothetical protein
VKAGQAVRRRTGRTDGGREIRQASAWVGFFAARALPAHARERPDYSFAV